MASIGGAGGLLRWHYAADLGIACTTNRKNRVLRVPTLNLPRARAKCSAIKLDFAAGGSGRALQARFRVEAL